MVSYNIFIDDVLNPFVTILMLCVVLNWQDDRIRRHVVLFSFGFSPRLVQHCADSLKNLAASNNAFSGEVISYLGRPFQFESTRRVHHFIDSTLPGHKIAVLLFGRDTGDSFQRVYAFLRELTGRWEMNTVVSVCFPEHAYLEDSEFQRARLIQVPLCWYPWAGDCQRWEFYATLKESIRRNHQICLASHSNSFELLPRCWSEIARSIFEDLLRILKAC
jgi:hypothetical protein